MEWVKVANNAQTKLLQDINSSATSFIVEDASKFPDAPFRVTIDDEIMQVGHINRATNTFSSITRGVENTTATSHNSGSSVENRWTAGTFQLLVDNIEATFQSASEGKSAIATAITGMGQSASSSDTFGTLATKIRNISKDANAVVGDVLTGKTFYQGGSKKTGTMANHGAKVYTPGTSNITIPKGYHNGSGYVKGDTNLKSQNIIKGKRIFGVTGTAAISKYASGSVTIDSNNKVNVSSLSFRPKIFFVYVIGSGKNLGICAVDKTIGSVASREDVCGIMGFTYWGDPSWNDSSPMLSSSGYVTSVTITSYGFSFGIPSSIVRKLPSKTLNYEVYA